MRQISVFLTAETFYNEELFTLYEVPESLKRIMDNNYRGDRGIDFTIAQTLPAYFDESDEELIRKYILAGTTTIVSCLKDQDSQIEVFKFDKNVITKPLTEEDFKRVDEVLDAIERGESTEEFNDDLFNKTNCPYEVVTEKLPNKIFIYCHLNYEEVGDVVPKCDKEYYNNLVVDCVLDKFEKGVEEYNNINSINLEDASRLLLSLEMNLLGIN